MSTYPDISTGLGIRPRNIQTKKPANIGISAGAIDEATVADVSSNPVPTSRMKGAPHKTASGIPCSQARKGTFDLPSSRVGVNSTAPSPKRNATTSQIPRW